MSMFTIQHNHSSMVNRPMLLIILIQGHLGTTEGDMVVFVWKMEVEGREDDDIT